MLTFRLLVLLLLLSEAEQETEQEAEQEAEQPELAGTTFRLNELRSGFSGNRRVSTSTSKVFDRNVVAVTRLLRSQIFTPNSRRYENFSKSNGRNGAKTGSYACYRSAEG